MIKFIESALILFALSGALTFVVVYPIRSDMKRWTREGWHIWWFTVALSSLGCGSLARRMTDVEEMWFYPWWMGATYLSLALLLWQRVFLLLAARGEVLSHQRMVGAEDTFGEQYRTPRDR